MSARVLPALAGLGAALLVTLLMAPQGCTDSIPPICYSALGYSVPDGSWWIGVSLAAGLLAAMVVVLVVQRTRAT